MTNPNTPIPGSSLLALSMQAAKLENLLIEDASENDGEINKELDAYLSEVDMLLADKVDAYKFIMDRLEMSSQLLGHQAETIEAASIRLAVFRENMKERLKQAMQARGVDELAGNTWRFLKIKGRKRVVVPEDLDKVPGEYITIKQTKVVDKNAIALAIESGKHVEGCSLEDTVSLRTYVAKVVK